MKQVLYGSCKKLKVPYIRCVRFITLTVLQCMLYDVVGHAAGAHRHVRHDIESVVPRRLQVVHDVAGGVVADDNLVFLVVETCG